MKKNKLLICALFMSMVLTVLPGMKSHAAAETGESAAAELQDENSQRLNSVTAMDSDGNIYEVGDADGTVEETDGNSADAGSEDQEVSSKNGISLFSVRSKAAVTMKVVNFNTKSNDTTDFTYSGGSGYTNGDYGADAAYLGTDKNGNIRFMLAGVAGTVKKSEVQVVDYGSVADNVSYYKVSGGKLIHYISYNLNKKPESSINNGPAPSYLEEGVKYYSYDGHYFYEDYETMLGDYQNDANGASAVNQGDAFYNYFQFLDMNSATNYSGDELNDILDSKISSSKSKLLGTGAFFVKYQDKYGVNALLSLGIAANESAWGTSNICMTKNNLFGLNAVDKTPGESAYYFASVEDCIREFMSEWMADGYLSSSDWRNHGELLGNKGEGINVSYASDPYWGEKAAAIAWELDAAGGGRDCTETDPDDGGQGGGANVPDTDDTPPAQTETPSQDTEEDEIETPSETETETPSETETETPSETETETPSETETETPSETETETETPSETETETPSETETETPSETETETETSSETETETPSETETETPSESENGDASDADTSADTKEPTENDGQDVNTPDTPADSVKPSVTGDGSDPDGSSDTEQTPSDDTESSKRPSDTDGVRTLVNADEKITVSGRLSADASLDIRQIRPNTEQYDSYVSADPVKGKEILGVYDIILTGTLDGEAQLTFRTGEEYNGRGVVILHYLDDGSYETYRAVVDNGQVSVSVKGFSPYVIALEGDTAGAETVSGVPQTGDTDNPWLWSVLAALSVSAAAAVLLKKRIGR